ncbi:hypothetical protein GX553_04185 [Candidatus Peribacteria bacterium]|nr:hypothetical protein [Candidatus Peribacteria bacterium]
MKALFCLFCLLLIAGSLWTAITVADRTTIMMCGISAVILTAALLHRGWRLLVAPAVAKQRRQ